MHMFIYVKYCIAIIHAAEPQATSPTGNRAKSNHSYRQPDCIHRFWNDLEGPWNRVLRAPWRTLEGPWRALDHQVPCFPRNLKGPKGP